MPLVQDNCKEGSQKIGEMEVFAALAREHAIQGNNKTHNKGTPGRPIISGTRGAPYRLAK